MGSASAASLSNDRYTLDVGNDGTITLGTEGMSPQTIAPEFTVLCSERDPRIHRNFNHPNYPIAPRPSLRWLAVNEPADVLNAWLATPAMKAAVAWNAVVTGEGEQRVWEYRDKSGKVALRVGGRSRDGATRPFAVGEKTLVRATNASVESDTVRWTSAVDEHFTLDAAVRLPPGHGDPEIAFTLEPRHSGFFSVAFTGAPSVPRKELLRVPQECAGRGAAQGDFVLSEADLKLPRVMTTTREGCLALVADPRECRFRLPKLDDSRFGLMLRFTDSDAVQPVLLAPLLGGTESKMNAGVPWSFTFRFAARAGDWKAMHRHIAQDIHALRDQRDNSGPGTLNGCLERIMDFLADRNGRNYAMWSDEQKYYDYFTDQTGVFKPFSPLYGLSAAIVMDDEDFYRRRARPAVEFALSRKYNVFAPYEGIYEAIVKSAASDVGGPYPGYAQLVSLHELLQRRAPGIRSLAEAKGPGKNNIADALAQWRLTGDGTALDAATKAAGAALQLGRVSGEQALFDFLELHDATHDALAVRGAVEAAYHKTTELNFYPKPPDENVLVDKGGLAPVHAHSFGRHSNIWGFQVPEPVAAREQTVPAWRVSRLGVASPAYPMEFWMNAHGALLRTAALAHDDFLRDVARNGMVGRFANYPGDNRSFVSLIAERADAVEAPPWKWNFATVNPGHAWDFAGAVIDFLVAEAFERSRGAIDFPTVSAAGSSFRVRVYGSRAGAFYGEQDAHLWLPRGLVKSDSTQLDWIAARNNGHLFLAFMNQSGREESADILIDSTLARCTEGEAHAWVANAPTASVRVAANRLRVTVPPKGIAALAIPATIREGLQSKLSAKDVPVLGAGSFADTDTAFGKVHAMLLSAGRGLTSAFVYAEVKPQHVIAARLRWRQGDAEWQEETDAIFPYEFSPALRDDGGDFQCVFEIEDAQQKVQRSPQFTLRLSGNQPASFDAASSGNETPIAAARTPLAPGPAEFVLDADFFDYLKQASNPKRLGFQDGRFFPYSTPHGRRIGFGLVVWDKRLFAEGCTEAEANAQLRAELFHAHSELQAMLAKRVPVLTIESLTGQQREVLLDFALSEGVANLRADFLAAVLADDWLRILREHSYIRYCGAAPDHARNKALSQRLLKQKKKP
jgi:hypothetical protein